MTWKIQNQIQKRKKVKEEKRKDYVIEYKKCNRTTCRLSLIAFNFNFILFFIKCRF